MNLLSPQARSICENKENTLILSLVSIWEMQIKSQLGKLSFNDSLREVVQNQRQTNRLELLPIGAEHIYALQELPMHHKDPFDRLLIAQANFERLPLLTADQVLRQYNVRLLH